MLEIKEILNSSNVAELLNDEELSKIGANVISGYEIDDASRAEWMEKNEKAMEIAKQNYGKKTHPFPGASNIKYPLITRAAIDFASRTYPEVVQGDRVVNLKVIGEDPLMTKANAAERVKKHITFQVLYENDEWEEGTDKLLHILPVIGTVFRKTYYNPLLKRNVSELCLPDNIVVNYNVVSLDTARRITHIIPRYKNDIIERIRSGIYLDIEIEELIGSEEAVDGDSDAPIMLLEQHCYLDLDEDDYLEPYLVTIHQETGKVLRIAPRFQSKDITKNSKKEILRIEGDNYFTDYHFIKSPDGGFYSLGLGQLLLPINEAINTTLNQLIDAGTISNNQSGFIGRGLRLKGGQMKLKLGEWKILEAATGMDIKNNIVPLPVREPSVVLYNLLGLLIDVGKDLSSVQDTMQGKGPTQNVPATTVLTMVEQGLKVFNSIQKRLFRSFKKEFSKIFKLNKQYVSNKEYQNILDDPTADVTYDYDSSRLDILPVSDPAASSDAQRMARARVLMEIPGLNPYLTRKYLLEALQIPDQQINLLLPQPDPNAPPPPEVLKQLAEVEHLKAKAATEIEEQKLKLADIQLKQKQLEVLAAEASARIEKMQHDTIVNYAKVDNVDDKLAHSHQMDVIKAQFEQDKAAIDATLKAEELALKDKEIEKQDDSKDSDK